MKKMIERYYPDIDQATLDTWDFYPIIRKRYDEERKIKLKIGTVKQGRLEDLTIILNYNNV